LYQSMYLRAQADKDRDDEEACYQHCLELLQYPYLPTYTRIETLHLLATVSDHLMAMNVLKQALDLIDTFERAHETTEMLRLLRQDNNNQVEQEQRLFLLDQADEVTDSDGENEDENEKGAEESNTQEGSQSMIPTDPGLSFSSNRPGEQGGDSQTTGPNTPFGGTPLAGSPLKAKKDDE